jgi:hypothetical protein
MIWFLFNLQKEKKKWFGMYMLQDPVIDVLAYCIVECVPT